MCGIFGAIGRGWDLGTVRALALINRERGTDSLGFFDSSGKMIKCADDPADALRKDNISAWLLGSANGDEKRNPSWFLAGHTRLATRGKVNRQNSHPFRYGRIIGCHNGMVDAPKGYVVDSQYLFDTLNKANGDYNKAWSGISGYWGVCWFDDNAFYLQVHNGDITVAPMNSVWYYSSSWAHLEACIGHCDKSLTLKEGQTLKFFLDDTNNVCMVEEEKFISTAAEQWYRRGYGNYSVTDWDNEWVPQTRDGKTYYVRRHGRSGKAYYESNTPSDIGDVDAEWRQAWEEYTGESEHNKIC